MVHACLKIAGHIPTMNGVVPCLYNLRMINFTESSRTVNAYSWFSVFNDACHHLL